VIDADYVRIMARYNAWQNQSIYDAADTLDGAARRLSRGAFFGSIHATLSHLLWGDQIWMSRFAGTPKPAVPSIEASAEMVPVWTDLKAQRSAMDQVISEWAGKVDTDWLSDDLTWFSGAAKREITKPAGILVTHFFNHQTHHRGQVHAMLTAAGSRPGDTDLFYLPAES
jgi:uncharacterized damage-inducible protein DinB